MAKRITLMISVFLLFASSSIFAASFIVRRIRIQGLQYIRESTVLSYLPVHIGQRFSTEQSSSIIWALYRTDLFSNVRLLQEGNTLIVRVRERPVISLIKISGNKSISTQKLKPVLQKFGIAIGQPYNSAKLHTITEGLQQEYDRMGRHAARVNATIKQEPGNRVAVYIHINEGKVAKVYSIHIYGNYAFSEHVLRGQFQLTTPGLFTFFTHHDRYSESQLEEDLQNLQYFYLNHGYLRFQVVSHQVTLTPDRKGVDIVINVSEGPQYRIAGYRVVGHFANLPQVQQIVSTIKSGDVFSRQQIISVNQSIGKYFADRGYAFPTVQPQFKIDDHNHTVFITFYIDIGRRIYVRYINIYGNDRTNDIVLRSNLVQMEASQFSLSKVEESQRRLAMLPYLRNVQVTPVPVVGHPDLVDLNYHATEVSAGRATIQGGYSDIDGFLVGANISEPNFMGTGKYVSLSATRTGYSTLFQFQYSNPFYTIDGVSRTLALYYSRTTANKKLNYDQYDLDDFGGSVSYGIPMSNYDTFNLGYGYDLLSISNVNGITSSNPASPGVLQFISKNKSPFSQFSLTGGWSHITLDRAVFPTAGGSQAINLIVGVPIVKRSVRFYKTTYDGKWYYSLGHGFIINPHAALGYGDGFGGEALPFYNNFYAGGIDTLPGFAPNSLGPKNPNNSFAAIGGNVELLGGINVIFPNFISDKLRTAVFLDAGNIFDTNRAQYSAIDRSRSILPVLRPISYESISLKNMRLSTGLMVSWYSPLGPIEFSLGFPLVKKKHDDTSIFGFSFGTSI